MLKNYLLSCVRHLRRHKTFTAINVLGLSIGMSAAVVIFMIVFYESGFDRRVRDHERIYRVVVDARFGDVEGHSSAVPGPVALAIPREVAGIEQVIPFYNFPYDGTPTVTPDAPDGRPEKIFKKQNGVVFTTNAYTDALQLQWLAGSPAVALTVPYQVVLTASRAREYFPSLPFSAITGRRIRYNKDFSAIVTGVVSDAGPQFSMIGSDLISFSTATQTALREQFMMNTWDDWMAYSQIYIKLKAGKNAADVQASVRRMLKTHARPVAAGEKLPFTLTLQPLDDVHFNSTYAGFAGRLADRQMLTGLTAIGIFLLLLGSINFINLTTADAARRSREIGVRKTLGSTKKQLIWLFLGETFFITTISALLSLVLVPVLFALFAGFLPPGLRFDPLHQPGLWIFLVSLILVVTFLSGLYPAFILSGIRAAAVLKNQMQGSTNTRYAWVRKGLTISQFVVAQFFLIATLTVAKQLHYALTMDMGFNKTAILSFDLPRERGDSAGMRQQTLLNLLAAIPEIRKATLAELPPAGPGMAITNISYGPKKNLKADVQIRSGNKDYLAVFGIPLVAGRNVLPSDTAREFLINESYAKLLGFTSPEQSIGVLLDWNNNRIPVVGVMRDFHASQARAEIGPMVFTEGGSGTVHVLLEGNGTGSSNWKNGIAKMQKIFLSVYPQGEFNYRFYDQQIASMYAADEKMASLLQWSSGLTILISCLGLLGLVIYTTRTRTKEISIRKVLGCSVTHIVGILSSGFLKLILIAFLIAAPLAGWATHAWLDQFAYRTPLSWWIFVLGGGGLMGAAMLTLSLQTIRAARANPVISLKAD